MPARPTEPEVSTQAGVRATFGALEDAFERATARTGPVYRDLLVAGSRVRLRAAGPALLEELWPALAHLRPRDGNGRANGDATLPPDLTIDLWDTTSTGVGLPEIAWMTRPNDGLVGNRVAHEQNIRMVYRPFEGEFIGLDSRRSYGGRSRLRS